MDKKIVLEEVKKLVHANSNLYAPNNMVESELNRDVRVMIGRGEYAVSFLVNGGDVEAEEVEILDFCEYFKER
jgi:hypothetical protein